MAISVRSIGIASASVISLSVVGLAFAMSGAHPLFRFNTANAESTDALLKAYAAKDSDNDGLPDWQESLYGTDPNNPHSVRPDLTDGQAVAQGLVKPRFTSTVPATATSSIAVDEAASIGVDAPAPGSLTEQFSHTFFQSYMETNGGQPLAQADQDALVQQLVNTFTLKARALIISSYTISDVRISNSVTIPQYVGAVEKVLRANDVPAGSGDPVMLMQAYVQNGDVTALPKLKKLAATYTAIAHNLALVSCPPELVAEHLQLMQSFDTLGEATTLVVNYTKDPIATFGAIAIYQPASDTIATVFKAYAAQILTQGQPQAGQPGALIVSFVQLLN